MFDYTYLVLFRTIIYIFLISYIADLIILCNLKRLSARTAKLNSPLTLINPLRGHCTITYPKNRVDKKLDQSACFLYHKKHENTKRQNKSSLKRHFTAA